jgi:DNA invertase Pin-like site-specific DNA recombinase
MFTMLGAIAEFERDLIADRTAEGRERAKIPRETYGTSWEGREGRKKALKLYTERESNGMSVSDVVKLTGVPRSTIYAKSKERGLV